VPKPRPRWAYKSPHKDSAARFVDAIRSARGRNLLDELLDPWRVHLALGEASPLHGKLPAIVPKRAPPCHTAAELAALWPLICKGLLGYQKAPRFNPEALGRRLRAAGLPVVQNVDGKPGHIWQGKRRVYFWTVSPVPASLLTDGQMQAMLSESQMEG
jgi:hypothetical protein